MTIGSDFRAVLFDLDGTLVDTAPDMVEALTRLLALHGIPALDYDLVRSNVSNGAAGLVRLAFPDVDEAERRTLHGAYVDMYGQTVCARSRVFPHLDVLLDRLDAARRPWGIVTNKPRRLTDPLVATLGLDGRAACVISGDSLPQRKPHPAPLLLAGRRMRVAPERIVYVGDAARDVEAGHAAGMTTIAAAYGYITDDDDPALWNADAIAADPAELGRLLAGAVGLTGADHCAHNGSDAG